MPISIAAVTQFFRDRAAALKRIAWATRGEAEIDDVQSEAWIVAADMEKRRGYPVDFVDKADQETLLGALYNRLVKFAEKHLRYAVKLDTDWDKEESASFGAVLARLLTAPINSDPAAQAQHDHDSNELADAVQISYSQAAAYVLLLTRFEWDAPDLAAHLQIALATLRVRLRLSGITVKFQPSLFDGVDKVDQNFQETIRRNAGTLQTSHLQGNQWGWEF